MDCIPADRIEWRYRDGKFSFADLLRHVAAIERYMFAEGVLNRPNVYPGHGPELADGYEAVLRYFNEKHEESMEIFAGLTPERLIGRCLTPAGASITVWKWLRAMVEHEIHHRGQIYIYLGILDIPTPPLYGLTSEEVFERAKP